MRANAETNPRETDNHVPKTRYMVGSDVYVPLDGGKKVVKGKIHDFDPGEGLFKVVWTDSGNVSRIEQLTKEELDIANFDPDEYRGRMADILEPAKPFLEYDKPLKEMDLIQAGKNDIVFLQSSSHEIHQFKVIKTDENGVYAKCVTGPYTGIKGNLPAVIRLNDTFVFGDKKILPVNTIEARKNPKDGDKRWKSVKQLIAQSEARTEISKKFLETALLDENLKLKLFESIKDFFENGIKNIRGFEDTDIGKVRSEFDQALKAPEENKYRKILIGIAKSMLNVNDDDNRAQIEKKSGRIMALYHPDRLSGEKADNTKKQLFEDIFSLLNSAKQLLIDNTGRDKKALAA